MNNLVINKLYIFSTSEKKAKTIEFSAGTNVITSSRIDGTKKGKSLILKSLYYVLGAESFFDSDWDVKSKIYIAEITICGKKYYIYRQNDLFKIFNSNRELLRSLESRSKLAECLADIYGFQIKLPGRADGELRLAKPVYSYLFNFIDQDKMSGPYFKSFDNLGEFADFKANLIYSQLGIFDEEYYEVTRRFEVKEKERTSSAKHYELMSAMLEKIEIDLDGNTYPTSESTLEIEISESQKEYNDYNNSLRDLKKKLISLRNNKDSLQMELEILKKFLKKGKKDVDILEKNICPECESEIKVSLEMRIKRYNSVDDLYLLFNQLESTLLKITEDIEKEQGKYRSILNSLKNYEERLKINSAKAQEILKHKGLIIIREDMLEERRALEINLQQIDEELKKLRKQLSEYNQLKQDVNESYYALMKKTRDYFELKEIDDKKLENIKSVFSAGGSSITLATIMWHFTLLKLKDKFNPNAIKFPIILDSPNNVETDLERKTKMFNYIFNEKGDDVQLIISALGFHEEENPHLEINNMIVLENESYQLLDSLEFEENQEMLNEFILGNDDAPEISE
jgi:Membrane-bound metallopeptidase